MIPTGLNETKDSTLFMYNPYLAGQFSAQTVSPNRNDRNDFFNFLTEEMRQRISDTSVLRA